MLIDNIFAQLTRRQKVKDMTEYELARAMFSAITNWPLG